MRARRARVVVPALLAALALGGCADAQTRSPSAPPVSASGRAPQDVAPDAPDGSDRLGVSEAEIRRIPDRAATPVPRQPWAFALQRRAQLRARPGGRVIATLGLKTRFGSDRILGVARRRDGWVAVRSELVGPTRVAWLPENSGALLHSPARVEIDLSARVLTVHRPGRRPARFAVAVGASATSTPVGRYAVTDRLTTGTTTGAYGCCILALSGRQPRLPQGWGGGDRLAIHGTSATGSIGQAVSSGCVRATNATMRRLLRDVLLGTTVDVHR